MHIFWLELHFEDLPAMPVSIVNDYHWAFQILYSLQYISKAIVQYLNY